MNHAVRASFQGLDSIATAYVVSHSNDVPAAAPASSPAQKPKKTAQPKRASAPKAEKPSPAPKLVVNNDERAKQLVMAEAVWANNFAVRGGRLDSLTYAAHVVLGLVEFGYEPAKETFFAFEVQARKYKYQFATSVWERACKLGVITTPSKPAKKVEV